MSFNVALVRDALRDFATAAVPIPWTFSNQDGDRPPRPYGTILVRTSEPIGQGDILTIGTGLTITERVRELVLLDVSFQTFGSSAIDHLMHLRAAAKRPSTVIGDRNTVLVGFLGAGDVRDLSTPISGSWEFRAQCDFRFTLRANDDATISTIGSVEISGAGTTQTIEEP